VVTSTTGLSEDESAVLLRWCGAQIAGPDSEEKHLAKIVLVFWYTGIHPAVFADRGKFKFWTDGKVATWERTKTREPILFPLAPEIQPWVREFLMSFPKVHPVTLNQLVHRAGVYMGIPELCPRSIRHTVAARLVEKFDFNTAKALTGTTDRVLIRYAKRKAAKTALAAIRSEGF
jgi:integrase